MRKFEEPILTICPCFPDLEEFKHGVSEILSFIIGFSVFLLFKKCTIGYNRFINTIASTTFGVLLIHASSDAMRKWLWVDLLDVPGRFMTLDLLHFVGFSLLAVSGIFTVCSFLDYLRIRFVEKTLFKVLGLR